jgi:co-chaperonin GroES (HSP10)
VKPLRNPNIETDLARLTPLYDFVLVERINDPDTRSMVVIPDRYRIPDTGLRVGVVVAIGRGDKNIASDSLLRDKVRHPMNIGCGDRVVYPRVPANDVMINGRQYTFLHEQQHILAVLENQSP